MIRVRHGILAGAAALTLLPGAVWAQEALEDGQAADSTATSNEIGSGEIVVTARQREERLQDVPVAVTAITGDTIKDQNLLLVKDVAAYTPGLNINSDSVGRAF
ncbi:MAG: TonB-dependent receptor, partial [Tsuneonella sp.]